MQKSRLAKLKSILKNPILIKKPENLLYLTGRSFMHGYLLVKPKRMNTDKRRMDTDVVFLGDGLEKIEGLKSDFLKNVGKYIGKKQTLEIFGEFTFSEAKYIKLKNPHLKLKITIKRSPADFQRQVKDAGEIVLIKKSMEIVGQVFGQVKRQLHRKTWTEAGLADFIRTAGLKLGAEDVSFPPIVASGVNAATPHHVPSNKQLASGESIIIDFGFKYKNYCSDFTRTVFLKSAPKKLAEAYNQVEKAYNKSINFINSPRPPLFKRGGAEGGGDILAGEVYQKAVDVLSEKNLQKYFIHSLGHGTGLEIHELPNLSPGSKDILTDGMVFSIEPGVYIPKLGGIRIEDLVYLDGSKVRKFINVPTDLKYNII